MGRHDKLLAQLLGGRADANVGFEAICALWRYGLTTIEGDDE